ncbi:MAG: hypothetical protein WCE68_07400 [Anaerolineales bacterium]
MEIQLTPRQTTTSSVLKTAGGWRLEIPAGPPHTYRLAQVDDYTRIPRSRLRHTTPWCLSLRVRISSADLSGTWGFGLWNDPFGLSLGFGGGAGRLPTLPQAVWFMYASPPNWLSLRDNPETIPANGFFAGTFRSAHIPSTLFTPCLLAIPLCAIHPLSRLLRRLSGQIIHQDAASIKVDVTQWHEYSFQWLPDSCLFRVDGNEILHTTCSPLSPLGLVLWIDNQFAAWNPNGQMGYGTLENPAAWMEIEKLNAPV